MHRSRALTGALVLALSLAGCAAMEERRWSWCAVGGGLLGAAIGGATAGVLVSEYEGGDGGRDSETAAAAAAGAAGGGLLGSLLGHLICDPIETAPPPPPPPPAKVQPAPGTKITEIKGVHFDFDKATIKPEGRARLDEAVRVMRENPNLRVVVTGHTDSVGSDAYNMKLGERRARAVADYLIGQGISPSRIDVRSEGESKPVASNATAEGRAENRRVEIHAL